MHVTYWKTSLPKKVKRKRDIKGLFERVWAARPHVCEICGRSVPEPLTFCFPHRLSKGTFPEYAECDANVAITCPEHHHDIDKQRAYRLAEIIENNERWLRENQLPN